MGKTFVINIQGYEFKVFSQFGEDGVIHELTRRLSPPSFFLEIGAGDGSENNTRLLAEPAEHDNIHKPLWSGIWIDQDPTNIHRANELGCAKWLRVVNAFVEPSDAGWIAGMCPQEIGLLSIDIDGNDYWLWKKLCETPSGHSALTATPLLRPWIVVIEAQIQKPRDERYVMPYTPGYRWDNASTDCGASIAALNALGHELGYWNLGLLANPHAPNMFFVRKDLLDRVSWG